MINRFMCLVTVFIACVVAIPTLAGEVRVAVASNFSATARVLGAAFEADSGHTIVLSFGSTGQLFTQISQGAPFDVFLAADSARPVMLVEAGLTDADSVFTYAIGRLALYQPGAPEAINEDALGNPQIGKIAIANPPTAPYGIAAMETLDALGTLEAVADKLVRGTNIAQTYQFVATGHAEIGLVAASQVRNAKPEAVWLVPANLHKPIRQNAALISGAEENDAAVAFLDFLKGPEARAMIVAHGYDVPAR